MQISTSLVAALAGSASAQLVLLFGTSPSFHKDLMAAAAGKHHAVSPGTLAQRPLGGSAHGVKSSSDEGLPAYKRGQHTLVEQDESLCRSYGERQWTGTVDVSDTRRLFFWAQESRGDPANDPVLFWMNGGPGGSSFTGGLTELGACMLWNDSTVPEPNPWSWNNNATVVFLDQPAGVGFSTVKEGAKRPGTDQDGAEDFQAFLNVFFRDVFPDKAHLPIHIAAESYGGHYGPTYVHHILESRRYGAETAFWGNITSMILVDAVIDFGGPGAGVYELLCKDPQGKGILKDEECDQIRADLPEMERIWRQCEQTLDVNVCLGLMEQTMNKIMMPYIKLVEKGERSSYHIHRPCPDAMFCGDPSKGNYTEYLNRKEVKKALGFPESFQFDFISWQTNSDYVASGAPWVPTTPKVAAILDAYQTPKVVDDGKSIGDVRIMVLNGNLDLVVNSHGNIMQYERVIWSGMGDYRAAKWHPLDEEGVAGKGSWKGTDDGRLVFMAVDDAGHMVPGDVPETAYRIVQRWLNNEWR